MKVKGKFLLRIREPNILVLMCSLEEKEFLIQNTQKNLLRNRSLQGLARRLDPLVEDQGRRTRAPHRHRLAPSSSEETASRSRPRGARPRSEERKEVMSAAS
jgi:hypothetical protein